MCKRLFSSLFPAPTMEEHYDYDNTEARFQKVLGLVKDLDKREFNKLKEALDLAWQGYEKIRQVQTREEKENGEIDKAEKEVEFIEVHE